MPDVQTSAGGIVAPNTYGKQNNYFWVLATGPGRYVKIGKNRVWISPECQRGDKVISRHWAREAPAGWHKTEHVEKEDQRSGVLVDARFIECVIGAEEKQT